MGNGLNCPNCWCQHFVYGLAGVCLFWMLCLSSGPDMCVSKRSLCPRSSLCINTLGSYMCVCQSGYYDVSSVIDSAASRPLCKGTVQYFLLLHISIMHGFFFNEAQVVLSKLANMLKDLFFFFEDCSCLNLVILIKCPANIC